MVKSTNLNLEICDMDFDYQQQQQNIIQQMQKRMSKMEEKYETRIAMLENKIHDLQQKKAVPPPPRKKFVHQHIAHLKQFVLKHNYEAADNFEKCRQILIDDCMHRYNLFKSRLQHNAHLLVESVIKNYQDAIARNDVVQNNIQCL